MLLTGCAQGGEGQTGGKYSDRIAHTSLISKSSETTTTSKSTETSKDTSKQTTSAGTSYELTSISYPEGTKTFEFYCVNDFHGAVKEQIGSKGYYECGISKYFGELATRRKEDPEHTILLSSGDMWQGSLESNDSKGKFVTEAMSAAGFSAMALGNHEFDWGIDNIKSNAEVASFPFLAGNIYYFATGERDEDFGISKVIEKDGIKIGIVGMIGEGQTTSITSSHVLEVTFGNPLIPAYAEAERLKKEEGTSINILVAHNDAGRYDYADYVEYGKSLADYFDAVFCAHSHSYNNETVAGVPLLQSYSNGNAFSRATITLENGVVTDRYGRIETTSEEFRTDEDVEAVVSAYMTDELVRLGNEHVGTIEGRFDERGVARIGCKAIFEAVVGDHPNLALAMMNSQRAGLSGDVTYSDIFKATPFANQIVVANIKGSDILREVAYNPTYTGNPDAYPTISPSSYYECAVIDYLYFHMDVNKHYDYFTNNASGNEVLDIYETMHPYALIRSHLKEKGTISASSYAGISNGFDLYQ